MFFSFKTFGSSILKYLLDKQMDWMDELKESMIVRAVQRLGSGHTADLAGPFFESAKLYIMRGVNHDF